MQSASAPWWQQVTALVSVSAGGVITGMSFVPKTAADITSPSSTQIRLLALEQSARAAPASDGMLRSAIVNVANYYRRLAAGKSPAEIEAIIWQHDSVDGVDHGASCAAFASLTLELGAQVVGQHSWVTGGTSYPWPLHKWADVRVEPNPASPSITSILQDAEAHHRWHALGDGYRPLPGDWVLFHGHVEVVTGETDGVLHTIGGDSLPNFSVNAHEYPAPLAGHGVLGFVNNGDLAHGGATGAGRAAPAGQQPAAGDQAAGQANIGGASAGTAGTGQPPAGQGGAGQANPGQANPGQAAIPGLAAAPAASAPASSRPAASGSAPPGPASPPAPPGSSTVPPRRAPSSGTPGTATPRPAREPGAPGNATPVPAHGSGTSGSPAPSPTARTGTPGTATPSPATPGAMAPGSSSSGHRPGSVKPGSGLPASPPAGAHLAGDAAIPGVPPTGSGKGNRAGQARSGRPHPGSVASGSQPSAHPVPGTPANGGTAGPCAAPPPAGAPARGQDSAGRARGSRSPGARATGARRPASPGPANGGAAIPGVPATARLEAAQAPGAPYARHQPPGVPPTLGSAAQQAFIAEVAPGAIAAQRKYGVPASVTIAQAIDESAWGQSILATKDHNLFGIKGTGPAGSDSLPTQEYQNGQFVTVVAPFRVYHDIAQSIDDHGSLLATSSYYRQPMADRHDPNAFAAALTGIYATDPGYGAKIIRLMHRYDLYRYDSVSSPAGQVKAASSGASIPGLPDPAIPAPVKTTIPPATTAPPTTPPARRPPAGVSPVRTPPAAAPPARTPPATATPGRTPAAPTAPARTSPAARARPGMPPGAVSDEPPAWRVTQTMSARRIPPRAGEWPRRPAPRGNRPAGSKYRHQIPATVRTAFLTTAKEPLLREEPLYRDVASDAGIRWELLAACDWMQCRARQRYSPVHGEKLGTLNPDGTCYRTRSEALAQCAADLADLAWAVYRVDLTAPGPLSVRQLANAFAAFRWGGLLRLHHTSAMEFPYSVAGLTIQHLNMRWPNIADPHTPDRPGSRFRMPFGAVPIVLGLSYPATA